MTGSIGKETKIERQVSKETRQKRNERSLEKDNEEVMTGMLGLQKNTIKEKWKISRETQLRKNGRSIEIDNEGGLEGLRQTQWPQIDSVKQTQREKMREAKKFS